MNKTMMLAALVVGTMAAAGAALPRCEYDSYTKRWPQLKGVTLAAADAAALDNAKNSGATLVRYTVPAEMPVKDLKAFVDAARKKSLFVALGCGARSAEIAKALKGNKDAIYAYVLDSAADVASVRAADPETPVAVPGKDYKTTLALPNVFYTADADLSKTNALRQLQFKTGARIYVPSLGDPGAGKMADLFLKFGWDWTYAGASVKDSPDAAQLEKRLNDRRIVGYAAGTIKYPDWLKSGQRYRGAGIGGGDKEVESIEAAAALGMNVVRIGFYSLGMRLHKLRNNGAMTEEILADCEAALEARIESVKRCLDCARRCGIKVVVAGPAVGDRDHFQEADIMALELRWWRKIAARLKGRPEIYGYDIVNEPCDFEQPGYRIRHRDFMILAAAAIREVDPDVTLVVEMNAHTAPTGFESPSQFGFETATPIPFDNVVYSPHFYQPGPYTHQGFSKRKNEYLNYSYPATKAKLDANRERFPGDMGKDSGEAANWNKDFIRERLRGIREFQLKYGARIWVGEFSVVCWADGGAAWLKDVTDLFEEYGWDYSYHCFRENRVWSLELEGEDYFSIKEQDHDTDRMKVMKAKWARNKARVSR